eukprot:PhM_4_TR16168/c3_g1_i5/m.24482
MRALGKRLEVAAQTGALLCEALVVVTELTVLGTRLRGVLCCGLVHGTLMIGVGANVHQVLLQGVELTLVRETLLRALRKGTLNLPVLLLGGTQLALEGLVGTELHLGAGDSVRRGGVLEAELLDEFLLVGKALLCFLEVLLKAVETALLIADFVVLRRRGLTLSGEEVLQHARTTGVVGHIDGVGVKRRFKLSDHSVEGVDLGGLLLQFVAHPLVVAVASIEALVQQCSLVSVVIRYSCGLSGTAQGGHVLLLGCKLSFKRVDCTVELIDSVGLVLGVERRGCQLRLECRDLVLQVGHTLNGLSALLGVHAAERGDLAAEGTDVRILYEFIGLDVRELLLEFVQLLILHGNDTVEDTAVVEARSGAGVRRHSCNLGVGKLCRDLAVLNLQSANLGLETQQDGTDVLLGVEVNRKHRCAAVVNLTTLELFVDGIGLTRRRRLRVPQGLHTLLQAGDQLVLVVDLVLLGRDDIVLGLNDATKGIEVLGVSHGGVSDGTAFKKGNAVLGTLELIAQTLLIRFRGEQLVLLAALLCLCLGVLSSELLAALCHSIEQCGDVNGSAVHILSDLSGDGQRHVAVLLLARCRLLNVLHLVEHGGALLCLGMSLLELLAQRHYLLVAAGDGIGLLGNKLLHVVRHTGLFEGLLKLARQPGVRVGEFLLEICDLSLQLLDLVRKVLDLALGRLVLSHGEAELFTGVLKESDRRLHVRQAVLSVVHLLCECSVVGKQLLTGFAKITDVLHCLAEFALRLAQGSFKVRNLLLQVDLEKLAVLHLLEKFALVQQELRAFGLGLGAGRTRLRRIHELLAVESVLLDLHDLFLQLHGVLELSDLCT